MSRVCSVCGKSGQVGYQVSHAHNLSKKKWKANLQTVRTATPKGARKVQVCTRCLRSGKVKKAA